MVIGLGMCQLGQHRYELALTEMIEKRTKAEPVSLARVKKIAAEKKNVEYFRVLIFGHFQHENERYLRTVRNGKKGWNVITPLLTDKGETVLVNRGFVSEEHRDQNTRKEGLIITDSVAVTGLIHTSEKKRWFAPENNPAANRWFWLDIPAIAASLNSSPNGGAKHLNQVAPFLIEAEAQKTPGGWPKGGVVLPTFSSHHLVYALSWFAFAAALAVVFVLYVTKRIFRRSSESK
jgi:surfeit locus 1 family protein